METIPQKENTCEVKHFSWYMTVFDKRRERKAYKSARSATAHIKRSIEKLWASHAVELHYNNPLPAKQQSAVAGSALLMT